MTRNSVIFQDDRVVPYSLGEKLYQTALQGRSDDAQPVEFVSFEEDEALGKVYKCANLKV